MNLYTVTAPAAGFSGESAGVVFRDGVGRVSDSTKEGRAAIEYFRRRGYGLALEGAEPVADEPVAEKDGPREPGDPGPELPPELPPFDPAAHNADEVLAYLDSTTDADEIARIIAAERDGKNRKTIIEKGPAA
ncbi:hypothetical protein [Streptomyces spiralis]